MSAGEGLRRLRKRAGLTTRQVAELSQKVAAAEANEEFSISHARMIQIENGSIPSIYKLFTLSAIYGIALEDLLSLYVNPAAITRYRFDLGLSGTRLADFRPSFGTPPVHFPVRFDPGFSIDKTNLIARMVQEWGAIPAALLERLNIRKMRYGFIGLKDYTMAPLIRPGSFVLIEEQRPPVEPVRYASEFDRPIWFLELRDGYICSWCEFKEHRVVSVPHPSSGYPIREFAFPRDAELVGRVTAVAARLTAAATLPSTTGAKPPRQS